MATCWLNNQPDFVGTLGIVNKTIYLCTHNNVFQGH